MSKEIYKIEEKVTFKFAIQRNAQEVALALASAGYYVKITGGSEYVVFVYTDRLTKNK